MLSNEFTRGFWCECWTKDLTARGRPTLTTSFGAYSAAQADSWLSTALQTMTSTLNPTTPMETWDGLYENRIATRRALLRTEPCTASITYTGTRITWTVRPVLFLPLADRNEAEPPACTEDFKPHTTH
ncbi:hypothetical protein [Streptomyces venezuelae]|uniref:hypothetical protein n=1 Tax=Streptomyces venezuelae TaxID=54571 RepID=UPI003789C00C